jgi:proline dehydrogenase
LRPPAGPEPERGTPFTVRLVKGAYWDYEVARARSNGFVCPVFTGKGLTDANFENITVKLIDHHQLITPAFASHNLRSLVHAMVVAEEKGMERTGFELQMLYGMAEPATAGAGRERIPGANLCADR